MPAPDLVIIIRHAEKPDDKSDPGLSPAGQARAKRLATLVPAAYPPQLDALFATSDSTASHRPRLTVEPLTAAINVTLDDKHAEGDEATLAARVREKHSAQIALICWHHGHIPKLAKDLGVENPPEPWDETDFDSVWEIRYDDAGRARLTQTTQTALQARLASNS